MREDEGKTIMIRTSPSDRPPTMLTPRETEALRAYFTHDHRGAAARTMGISENTLKTHLAAARRKLGMPDREIVALLFPEHAGPHPRWTRPHRVIADNTEMPFDDFSEAENGDTDSISLNDVGGRIARQPTGVWGSRRNDLNTMPRIMLIAIATLAVVAALILAFAFSDGLQRWSNTIAPATSK